MMFTDEEMELELSSFIIPNLENQDLVKRIHLMFGGKFSEKDKPYCNHVVFTVNSNYLIFVYNSDGYFIYKSPYSSSKNVNGWKLKKLIRSITDVLKEEKERVLRMKLSRIEGDF